tara:strand:+ start:1938 stop:2723 length:786 start_codon:yes stop_codon:yes gene_type:complete
MVGVNETPAQRRASIKKQQRELKLLHRNVNQQLNQLTLQSPRTQVNLPTSLHFNKLNPNLQRLISKNVNSKTALYLGATTKASQSRMKKALTISNNVLKSKIEQLVQTKLSKNNTKLLKNRQHISIGNHIMDLKLYPKKQVSQVIKTMINSQIPRLTFIQYNQERPKTIPKPGSTELYRLWFLWIFVNYTPKRVYQHFQNKGYVRGLVSTTSTFGSMFGGGPRPTANAFDGVFVKALGEIFSTRVKLVSFYESYIRWGNLF